VQGGEHAPHGTVGVVAAGVAGDDAVARVVGAVVAAVGGDVAARLAERDVALKRIATTTIDTARS
jgi:hypothetical protein